MNISEKILAAASGRDQVKPGEIVEAKVDMAMINEYQDAIQQLQPVKPIQQKRKRVKKPMVKKPLTAEERTPEFTLATAQNQPLDLQSLGKAAALGQPVGAALGPVEQNIANAESKVRGGKPAAPPTLQTGKQEVGKVPIQQPVKLK